MIKIIGGDCNQHIKASSPKKLSAIAVAIQSLPKTMLIGTLNEIALLNVPQRMLKLYSISKASKRLSRTQTILNTKFRKLIMDYHFTGTVYKYTGNNHWYFDTTLIYLL